MVSFIWQNNAHKPIKGVYIHIKGVSLYKGSQYIHMNKNKTVVVHFVLFCFVFSLRLISFVDEVVPI